MDKFRRRLDPLKPRKEDIRLDIVNPTEPIIKILPDVPPDEKLTLFVDLDLFVHMEHRGVFPIQKRAGADYFLDHAAQMFELVLFTDEKWFRAVRMLDVVDDEAEHFAFEIFLDRIMKQRAVRFWMRNERVKLLKHMNRDPRNSIMLDSDPRTKENNSRNCILLHKWHGEPGDMFLFDLVPFLEELASKRTRDVRTIVDKFPDEDSFYAALHEQSYKRNRKYYLVLNYNNPPHWPKEPV